MVIRNAVARARDRIDHANTLPVRTRILDEIESKLVELTTPSLRRVINATGVVLHTGLGRAPLASHTHPSILDAAGYCNLEIDLTSGERGDRQAHVDELLCLISGAASALVVNNNAAALYLTLNSLAYGKEVIVSRGQLIEIGGSFRLPDIMQRAGVKLVEVGTTNRTRIADYRDAINKRTALLLRAYPSNFRIDGFTESVSIDELAGLSREYEIPLVDDLGGGLMWDWTRFGLPHEPTVRESLQAGADLVLVSGDKALGGPQAGIILGHGTVVKIIKRAPLARVMRPEKLTLAALATILQNYLLSDGPAQQIPAWQMLTEPLSSVTTRAGRVLEQLRPLANWDILETRGCESETGSGTLPAVAIPSCAIRALPSGASAARWAKALRNKTRVPVISTVRDDSVWFDLRTIQLTDEPVFIDSVRESLPRS